MTIAVLYTTFADIGQARTFAKAVLAAKLAACVNVLPQMTAFYEWQEEMHEDAEVAALIKTRPQHRAALLAFLETHHPYDTPAALWLDSDASTEAFGAWVVEQTEA